jgi:Xaa-Pro aminopeptidase
VFRDEGSDSTGYPSIVGAHSNATILHYNTNNDPLVRNGLMLIDAAAEVEGYTADVTRTWPVDGTFSEAQADIYNLVFEAQSASMAASKKDVMYNVMVKASYDVASKGLLKLGLISEEKREQVSLYYLHGIAHGIGLDVHDPLPRQTPLAVNNVYTIEPGIYVRKGIVENSDVFKALAPDVQKTISVALTKYNNIGVRIEDDILITEDGYENLSKDVPRSIAAIEKHLKQP